MNNSEERKVDCEVCGGYREIVSSFARQPYSSYQFGEGDNKAIICDRCMPKIVKWIVEEYKKSPIYKICKPHK